MLNITMLEKELQKIRRARLKGKYEYGIFGFKECKLSIAWTMRQYNMSLQHLYAEYIKRALTELGFNTNMIVACEEMMEETI